MSIQARLLLAVGILTLSTLVVGSVSWYWLTRSNNILEDLHKSTLREVNRSHELTKQSSVFTTSAPFLLNLTSSYLVESKGNQLLLSIDQTIESWSSIESQTKTESQYSASIIETLRSMHTSIVRLIDETQSLSANEDSTRLLVARLTGAEKELERAAQTTFILPTRDAIRQAQLAVKSLVTATRTTSLISLGEYQRSFQQQVLAQEKANSPNDIRRIFSFIKKLTEGPRGLFALRISILEHNVAARRALTGISEQANILNAQVLELIRASELEISERQEETSKYLRNAKILILSSVIASLVTALSVALFISGYIVRNLNTVSVAMTALAKGDIGNNEQQDNLRFDEIGNLQASFQVFRANAIKLNRLNKRLIQETALFESMFNNINDGIAVTNADGKVLVYNPMLSQLLSSFDHEANVETNSPLSEKIAPIFRSAEENGQISSHGNYQELRNQHGNVLEIRVSELPDGGKVWLFSDTTERRRIEERLQHFHRLESLGQLTGEVAHDVNNVLCAIKTTLPIVISQRTDSRAHSEAIGKVEDAVDLGSSFTNRLLAFAKKQQLIPKTIEVNELVTGVSDLIALSLGNEIDLVINSTSDPVFVNIDPLQLESALLNLCLNSAHAINGVGTVSLSVNLSSENKVALTVEDNGCGMSPELLRKAVEPFYSTRRGGRGSGLGLSIVYGFIKQSGGDMHIESTERKGTTVTLLLDSTNEKTKAAIIDNSLLEVDTTVLIVEDCAETLQYAVGLFQHLGMTTLTAHSFEEAKAILQSESPIAYLFTDLHLGSEQTGWDIAEACINTKNINKIIVTSGRKSEILLPPSHLADKIVALAKPYNLDELNTAIKKVKTN